MNIAQLLAFILVICAILAAVLLTQPPCYERKLVNNEWVCVATDQTSVCERQIRVDRAWVCKPDPATFPEKGD